MKFSNLFVLLLLTALFLSCDTDKKAVHTKANKLFTSLKSSQTGIDFNNSIIETKELNYYRYVYLYNGGGVGISDINNDGLQDVYFTSTTGKDKLYLNKGNFKFEDISDSAGIDKFGGCKTGVSFIDINYDGWTDIYVCRAGWSTNPEDRTNLLFINKKDNSFVEAAATFGLNDTGYSIQSCFLDYDKDGDLDMFLSSHPKTFVQPIESMIQNVNNPNPVESDKLYRNDGNGKFTNVSQEAGILNYTYGLGVIAADLNDDGWTDIYVTSDFQPRDHFYLNKGDGTFEESLEEYFPHCSYFAMGIDFTDLNGDSKLDIFTGEMLAEDNLRQKTNMAPMDMRRFSDMVNNGMHYQYMRNSMQINNGKGYFSDVAHYSGIDQSDWSWASLFADYDHDGDDDLLIANGWLKDTQDKDFSSKSNKLAQQYQNRLTFEQAYSLLKSTPLPNYAFRNEGNLKFEKVSKEWGFDFEGFSNGMAFGDLDNDGDLDVVVNNINDPATVLQNEVNDKNYLRVKLQGPPLNSIGLNAKLTLKTNERTIFKEFHNTRGFQSACEPFIHFGLKSTESPNSLTIKWPDNKLQVVNEITTNELTVFHKDAQPSQASNPSVNTLLKESQNLLPFIHEETIFDDYKVQVLLPHKLSQLGPTLTKGDVNGDGLEDLFIGGAHRQASSIWLQKTNGEFQKSVQPVFESAQEYEDVAAAFFDVDNDKDLDLYVVSGSNEFVDQPEFQKDRLYLNDGKGKFSTSKAIPEVMTAGGCVSPGDFDNDGDLDLFIGGRIEPGKYPSAPKSLLLENQDGTFVDVTDVKAEGLTNPGMITDAIWSDYDQDKDLDLILVGEWTDVLFFENNDGRLSKAKPLKETLSGWWNVIKAVDLDNDGDDDYLIGNLGENYKYEASNEAPFEVFGGDFDNSGVQDIVVSYYNDDKLFPVRGFQCSSEQIPDLKKKINSYEEFGSSDVFQVYGSSLENALHYKANIFSSIILWNEAGSFEYQKLPFQAQLSPIQAFEIYDFDKDGKEDIFLAGNWFVSEVETPRADSGTGLVLKNLGDRSFEALSIEDSGFFVPKDVRALSLIKTKKEPLLIIGNNNDKVQVFSF